MALLLLLAGLGGIMLLGEQLEAHRLRAFIFNFEVARHRGRADVEGMRLAGSPIGQHPELGRRTIKLRLVSQYDRWRRRRPRWLQISVQKRGRRRNAAHRSRN